MHMYVDNSLEGKFNIQRLAKLLDTARCVAGSKYFSNEESRLLYRFVDMLKQIPFDNYNIEVRNGSIINIAEPEKEQEKSSIQSRYEKEWEEKRYYDRIGMKRPDRMRRYKL